MSADRSAATTCANCGQKPGTIRWGDALAVTHGFSVMWCSRCVARTQLRHAVARAIRIPVLAWRSVR